MKRLLLTMVHSRADYCPADAELGSRVIRLRWWAVFYLNDLGDSTAQAISGATNGFQSIIVGSSRLMEQSGDIGSGLDRGNRPPVRR